MSLQLDRFRALRSFLARTIPDRRGRAPTGCQVAATAVPGEFAHFGGIAIHLQILPRLREPEVDRGILVARGNEASVGTPGQSQDRALPLQDAERFLLLWRPEGHVAIGC